MVDGFVGLSGDDSPIHVSNEAARARGFPGRVVHGLLLGALVSSLIGTELPGAQGVLQDFQICFRFPCAVGDQLIVRLWVADFHESVRTLILKFEIENQEGLVLATGSCRSGVT
jgi:3-hydroxybutyryl-CoA dehydratase